MAKKTKNPTEKEIENSILEYLNRCTTGYFWKNNSTGVYDPVKKIFRKNKGKFLINGVSDILGIYNCRFVAIEVKSKTGRLSVDQRHYLENIESRGALCGVARSIDDAMSILKGKD